MSPSAAPFCRPPLLPRMPCFPLALLRPGRAHPLALVFARLYPVHGGAEKPRIAVAASQVPPPLGWTSQQTGLALHRDPLAPFAGQVPDAAQAVRAVAGPHAARHLQS